ncbi:hypothetical protein [Kibdelosporangium phytohabitans]|uniref:DUF4261 domain-containing protein n=1 Tax=Kibdelosporangium phytohabitans TaxID=860235 RepID=A0A0N9IBU8_9PSEU|nr:hypothetical protein [Kibdelosporangium phytohabitans]ALG12659.1 hypothetical protein AOZ06_42580 [Kibdelosporangium phytohabitans]MBE1464310.1 hypothetical protein [Kibdelosporangium phytohabitans]
MVNVVKPRHVLCAIGSGLDFGAVEEVVRQAGGLGFTVDREYSEHEADPRMADAFKACMAEASFTDADWAAVAEHDSVTYVLSPPMTAETSVDVSQRVLAVVDALLRNGVTAVKNESNGLAHGRDHWLTLAGQLAGADEDFAKILLHSAFVKRLISDGSLCYTCGMHLLGVPEVEIDTAGVAGTPDERADLADGLAIYLLTEERAGRIQDGEGFRLSAESPRWLMHSYPCDRYEDDDFFHNPYGAWRLTPAN